MSAKLPGVFPTRVLQRIRHQAAVCSQFQSCQSEIIFHVPSGPEIDTWNAGPPLRTTYILLADLYQILPYTTLEFSWHIGAAPAGTPYHCPIAITNGLTSTQVMNFTLGQFELWKATHAQQFPDMRSLRLVGTNPDVDPTLTFYMPWGMLGLTGLTYSGPNTSEAARQGNPGVDNPLLPGLWGPQRFLLPVNPEYQEDYYGDVPIG